MSRIARPPITRRANLFWVVLILVAAACDATLPASPTPPVGLTPTAPATAANALASSAAPGPTTEATGTPTPEPTPTSTPSPAARQLTTGGCCVQPSWSPDGSQIWYIDRPTTTSPSGIWGIAVAGGEPQFITDRLGLYSPDRALLAFPEGGRTIIERLATGERWVAPSAGRAIAFSPDGQLIAWSLASSTVNFDRRLVEVWVANVDGSDARQVAQLRGGGFSGWFPDSQRLLISGRDEAATATGETAAQFIGVLNLADDTLQPFLTGQNFRGTSLSPGGGWLLYTVAFSGDPALDGQWVVPTSGGAPRRVEPYGAVRWRAEGRLLTIPIEWGSPAGLRVVEIEAATGAVRALTDPALTPLPIAGGDWSLSPDGRRLVFVSTVDRNLWVLELPE